MPEAWSASRGSLSLPIGAFGMVLAVVFGAALPVAVLLLCFLGLIHITSPETKASFEPLGEALAELAKFTALLVFGAPLAPRLFGDLSWGRHAAVVQAIFLILPALLLSRLGTRISRTERWVAAWVGRRASPPWRTGAARSPVRYPAGRGGVHPRRRAHRLRDQGQGSATARRNRRNVSDWHSWAAIVVFVGAYALIISEKIHRVAVALGGAGLMLAIGATDDVSAFYSEDSGVDWNVIFLLMGMMMIVGVLKKTGMSSTWPSGP